MSFALKNMGDSSATVWHEPGKNLENPLPDASDSDKVKL
jgi:hypothetical protein